MILALKVDIAWRFLRPRFCRSGVRNVFCMPSSSYPPRCDSSRNASTSYRDEIYGRPAGQTQPCCAAHNLLNAYDSVCNNFCSGGAVARGTTIQVGGSRVRFPMVSLEFFIDIILPAALWPLGSTQPLTEMSTRNISWKINAVGV